MSEHVCTRFYRPPEVILCTDDYDYKVDVWSLGCILSEVLHKTKQVGQEYMDVLFPGDSCFPCSPLPKKKEQKVDISPDDQLVQIIKTLGVKKEEGTFLD